MAVGKTGYTDVTIQPSSVGKLRVFWREDYDALNNYSTMTVTDIQGYLGHRVGWANIKLRVTAGDVVVFDASSAYNWMFSANADGTLRSVVSTANYQQTFTPVTSGAIYHDNDGTKMINLVVTLVDCYVSGLFDSTNNLTGSSTVTLTPIPRASDLSTDNGTLGVSQTLTVDRKADGYTHTIDYACGSASGTICTKSDDLSIAWTPPIDLALQNTTGVNVSVVFTITTYSGDTMIGTKTLTIICVIPETVKPSVSMAITDANGYANKYGGFVQSRSKFKVVLDITTAYGSEISVNTVSVEGVNYYGTTIESAIINGSGVLTLVATVTDKRGRTGTETVEVDVLEYAPPAITGVTYNRADADGTDNVVGEYAEVIMNATVTALGGNNSATYKLQYKRLSETAYTDFDMSEYQNVYSLADAVAIFSASADYSYNVIFTVSDDFSAAFNSTAKTEFILQTGKVLMHRRAGGKGMGLGRICEEDDLLDVDWDIRGRKNLQIDGALNVGDAESTRSNLGITPENIGAAATSHNHSASDITDGILSIANGGTSATSAADACNNLGLGGKVLWSGIYYMTADHTVNLTETISSQPNGVVFAFSPYTSSTARDYEWVYIFIPKYHVTEFNGKGTNFSLVSSGMVHIAHKYLYIYDDKITGHASNDTTGTVNGVTYENNYFVLRRVIGV